MKTIVSVSVRDGRIQRGLTPATQSASGSSSGLPQFLSLGRIGANTLQNNSFFTSVQKG
jgi:hypothetical protein